MCNSWVRQGIGALVWIPLVCLATHARADVVEECPSAALTFSYAYHWSDVSSDAAALDTTFTPSAYDSARVTFDRVAGRLSVGAVGRLWAGERVVERFDVSGVPIGTPVPATIVFALDAEVLNRCGGGGCGAYFIATLASGADSVIADASLPGPCDCTKTLSTTLELPVTITAGTPVEAAFRMLYHTSHVAWGRVSAVGFYGVTGLPSGVRAMACRGADLTPVRRTTWGQVKSAYR